MKDLIRALRKDRSPSGELYLSKDKADYLINTLEICERALKDYESAVIELKKLMEMSQELKNEIDNCRSST